MTGLDRADVLAAVELRREVASGASSIELPSAYEIDNTSERIVRFLMSTARRHHVWAGIRSSS
jgi:UDP-N-acetyl-L-fucosamine synthase